MVWVRRAGLGLLAIAVLAGLAFAVVALDIVRFASERSETRADAALVLGAAVYWDRPSPVLTERLRHAAVLYEEGRVRKIVLTGGNRPGDRMTEAEAGRRWLLERGVPDADLVVEGESRTTEENFALALPLLAANDIETVLVVSDPIHMRRAMVLAQRSGIAAEPSPTATSRFESLTTQLPFLMRETWFMTHHLLTGG